MLGKARAGSIIIFHINGRGHKTAEALPAIVRGLRERGFRFVHAVGADGVVARGARFGRADPAGAAAARGRRWPAAPPRRAAPGGYPAAAGSRSRAAMSEGAQVVRASPAVARKQADWIAGIEPWKGLGYRAQALGRYLGPAGARR